MLNIVYQACNILILQHEERRVASLETKLSSLSETVGNYDRQREQDQTAILWVNTQNKYTALLLYTETFIDIMGLFFLYNIFVQY